MTLVLHTSDDKNEGNDFGWTMARVVGENGLMLVTADVEAVDVFVYDETVGNLAFGSGLIYFTTILSASVMFDSPQRDRRWTLPDEGYNFAHYMSADTAFQAVDEIGGHTYRLEYRITTTATNASGVIFVVRRVRVAPIYSLRA